MFHVLTFFKKCQKALDLSLILDRDGNGADRDRIMGDPILPRTTTVNIRPRPAPMVGATYVAPLPNRHAPYCPAPPRKSRICFYWLGGCTGDRGLLVGYAGVTRCRCSSVGYKKRWISSKLLMVRPFDWITAGVVLQRFSEAGDGSWVCIFFCCVVIVTGL